ncbi:MAG TPA: NAD(P)H-quinone oxidoreductase [Terriglobales bacterium]|nr:NAD(P)H-quinone oxidoreductase [Terriglobales bacterium]
MVEITHGGPEVLRIAEVAVPKPGFDDVLLNVSAAGVNRADILQRRGLYPPPTGASSILGLEVSGHITEVGADVKDWKPGAAVCALLAGGGYAEYCVAPSGQCLAIPENIAVQDAAALPEALFTVWANLFQPSRLIPGETLLVHGGTSGVGSMAIQVARTFGARVVATAGNQRKCDFCLQLGCELALNYREENWVEGFRRWSGGRGIDVILDMVGGDYFPKHLQLLAPQGRLIQIAYSGGREVTADLSAIMQKRLIVTGSTLRPRPIGEKAALRDSIRDRVWPQISLGKIRPIVDRVFSLEHVADAHRRMESSEHIGKILLRLD